ncbi:MAG: hypothetical protein KBT15_00455 [Bacteroidales bacterium]|nr:hypothetical protein [Candidatus Minthousia equi]MDO4956862.1 hypothetical protein [Bacteroidales bacterium]
MKDWVKVAVGALIVILAIIGYQKYQSKKKVERIHELREQYHQKMEKEKKELDKQINESRKRYNKTIQEFNSIMER